MATFHAVRAVGNSIVKFLDSRYEPLRAQYKASFKLVSSGDLSSEEPTNLDDVVSLFLYRITVSEQLRNMRRPGAADGPSPLPLNLHYLLTAWTASAEVEHTVMTWAMRVIHEHPILDASALMEDGGWRPDEVIHVAPEELTNEEMMRLWDALAPAYRLSYTYVARVVVIDPEQGSEAAPVVARRTRYGEL
jgi:hypothetical protein